MAFKVPEKYRIKTGAMGSDSLCGNNGAFEFYINSRLFYAIASDFEWEHVSVSTANRCPNWSEMCFIKDLFWDKEDLVVQYHPRESEYVNNHENCLHLWRKVGYEFPSPPHWMIGIK